MATLLELRGLFTNSDLQEKVESALIIAVQALLDGGTPTTDQQKYAAAVFAKPAVEARKALMSVLAKNASATVTQIQEANDTAIQTNVNDVVDALVIAYNAA